MTFAYRGRVEVPGTQEGQRRTAVTAGAAQGSVLDQTSGTHPTTAC